MKKISTFARVAIVAAVVVAMGATVYAANAFHWFAFLSGDKFVTVRTTDQMTEQQAREMVEEPEPTASAETGDEGATIIKDFPITEFASAAEAEREMDVKLLVPQAANSMVLDKATGQTLALDDGYESRMVWLNYSDANGRMLGVTTTREIIPVGTDTTAYTTHDIDEGSLGQYRSKLGVEFQTLTESDDSGEKTAYIAFAVQGEYEYAIVFFGFEEAERQEILDSVDLSIYK